MDIFGRKKIAELRQDVVELAGILCDSQAKCIELEQCIGAIQTNRDYWRKSYWSLWGEHTNLKRRIKTALGEES